MTNSPSLSLSPKNSIPNTLTNRMLRFCLEQKLVMFLSLIFMIFWGIYVAPFDWEINGILRNPVPVDAIPDIGENQQIVFTEWPGRSPQDVENQITYPLTTSLLGVPGVKTVRSYSMFGFSSIYIIFEESFDFYWTRTRILEKLNSLPAQTLPDDVKPSLGPDATALGQIFWYNLEGQDEHGNPTGGWDLNELRTVQDWYVRYALTSAYGVSEVASVGGYTNEYQIDVDPDAMRAYGVTLQQVFDAIRFSNLDVGARTIEINKVDYIIRGLGFIRSIEDIEMAVVEVREHVPIYVKNVANVTLGPALRLGILDKEGAEVTGGVVVARYGSNPLEVIKNVKKKIEEISPSLPKKVVNGTVSQVKIVPFYDRTGLIYETLETLNRSIEEEILITIIVILLTTYHLKSVFLISGVLPVAVLMCFIGMKYFKVDANIVALSGIAIAIGTIVDMGIILCENILQHLENASPEEPPLETIYRATTEVGDAIATALATTVISFLPVFAMTGAEGKLFKPLAYTKTLALISSLIVALTIIPPFAHILFTFKIKRRLFRQILYVLFLCTGVALSFWYWNAGLFVFLASLYALSLDFLSVRIKKYSNYITMILLALIFMWILNKHWLPLGPDKGLISNFAFTASLCFGAILFSHLFIFLYRYNLSWCLNHKFIFLSFIGSIIIFGLVIWQGFGTIFSFIPEPWRKNQVWSFFYHEFPGLEKEFMPPLDEGSYLLMPVSMPHASTGEVLDLLQKLDRSIRNIPEITQVVGKAGRAESPLDPAPLSMIETLISYQPEYIIDQNGHRLLFQYDEKKQEFMRDQEGKLIPDLVGKPFRNWRPHIKTHDDIWDEIVKAAVIPGLTSAPKLQPISTRLVMLQSGIRAPMAVKIKGPDLKSIEQVGFQIEKMLKQVLPVQTNAVIADRIIGGPYLEIDINREAISRYGLNINQIQHTIEVAIGGIRVTTTVEGRERFPVRVRYLRELRDSLESLEKILVPGVEGTQIPLSELAKIRYVRGPTMIKSEDTFLTGYVLFDKKREYGEVYAVEEAQKFLKYQEIIFKNAFRDATQKAVQQGRNLTPEEIEQLPGLNLQRCSYSFAGTYENQVRSEKTLMVVIPLSLFLIFMILHFQFRSVLKDLMVFSGIVVCWSGGFIMIWLYSQEWFLNFTFLGIDFRELLQVHPFNLSVAVWVGFLALFGIASDDGVVMATYLDQSFANKKIESVEDIRALVLEAGLRRVRPCLMTSITTLLALIPILTATGRGADVVLPMAIPSFGGIIFEMTGMFVVPTLYCLMEELKFKFRPFFLALQEEK